MVAMNREQHRDRVSEIVVDDGAEHTLRKIRFLQLRHIETELGPELLGILQVVFQVEIDEHGSVHAGRVRFLAAYSFDFEKALFDLLCDLVLDLRGGRAWIKSSDNSLAHMD